MLDGVVLAVVLLICFLLGILWLVVRPFTRVVDYEESYLKLEFRGLCAPLFTIIFTVSGLFVMGLSFTTPPLSTLTCQRVIDSGGVDAVHCEMKNFDAFGHEVSVMPVRHLKKANLEEYLSNKEGGNIKQEYFIALVYDGGTLDFGAMHETYAEEIDRISGIVDRINRFIEDSAAETLSVANDLRGDFYGVAIIGVSMVLVAFLIYIFRERVFLEIDIQAQMVAIQGYRLLKNWQTREAKFNLENIKGFSTEIVTDTGPELRGKSVGLVIHLKSGEVINLKNTFDSRGGKDDYVIFLNRFLKQDGGSI